MLLSPPALSAVFKGVAFEHRALQVLNEHLSMSLRRVGGKGDGGIDLQGWWWLPSAFLDPQSSSTTRTARTRVPLRVFAQCKAEEKKIGPRFIREFEGAVLRYSAYLAANHAARASQNVLVGLFVATSPFTKASVLQAYSSPIPLALLHLPESSALDSSATAASPIATSPDAPRGSLLFNSALSGPSGLLRGVIEARWERSPHHAEWRPGIWRDGRRIESWTPNEDRAE